MSPTAPRTSPILGVIALACTVAAIRHAKDADRSPDMATRVELLGMSAHKIRAVADVESLAAGLGGDARGAADPYLGFLGDFDERLRPLDWPERLVKSYLALGLLDDLCQGLVDCTQQEVRDGLARVLGRKDFEEFTARQLADGIESDSQLAARLGLWGRHVIGEEIGVFQRMLSSYPELVDGGAGGQELHERLAAGATSRMRRLGLSV